MSQPAPSPKSPLGKSTPSNLSQTQPTQPATLPKPSQLPRKVTQPASPKASASAGRNSKSPAVPTLAPAASSTPASSPITPTPTASPTPAIAPTTPITPARDQKAFPQDVPAPSFLDPNPNPLQFPTKPEEVRIQSTQPITLQQALELANRNNRQLQISQLELERSRAALREAQADEYPTLSTQLGLVNQGRGFLDPGGPQFDPESSSTTALSGTVQLGYDLYTSGRRSATIQAAEGQVRFNELDVERLTEETYLTVVNDYYALQEADEQVRIAQSAVTNAQRSLRDAQALERAGVGTRFDVLRAQVQLANATQDLTQARSQQEIARRQLAQRLSLPQAVNITAADPVEISATWNLSLEDSIVQAFRNRAELEQQLVQREISDQQRRIALSTLGPQISLSARYNLQNTFNNNQSATDNYSLGATVSLSLFEGGAARARATQAERSREIAETRFADTRNQIRFQVEQSYSTLQANLESIQTASVALTQAQESLRLARLRFQAGVGTQTDVISAETELTRAQGNLVQAILGYNRALASLRRAISTLSASGAPGVP